MKLCFWRGSVPNFGDDLNPWLWSKILPGFFDNDEEVIFIGMGSILERDQILSYNFPSSATKIVFGSGYGGYGSGEPPTIDQRWKVYFVRGPRTAKVLGIDLALGIGDPASLVGTILETKSLLRGASGPAFMPHWESAVEGSWEAIARSAGLRYIDPRWPVDRVLKEIAASSTLVTEAMHGAIVADSLRVPWIPFSPIGHHHFKWYDWADSLGIKIAFAPRAPVTVVEALTKFFEGKRKVQERLIYHGSKYNLSRVNQLFEGSAAAALKRASMTAPHLSSDEAFSRVSSRMLEKVADLRADFVSHASSF